MDAIEDSESVDITNVQSVTNQVLQDLVEDSRFFSYMKVPNVFPAFLENEIQFDEVLGQGEFGVVKQMVSVAQQGNDSPAQSHLRKNSSELLHHALDFGELLHASRNSFRRKASASQCAPYAVKMIRNDLKGEDLFNATVVLAVEAKFLMSMEHPNIVKIRATAGKPGTIDFKVIMDKLGLTVEQQVKIWKEEAERCVFWRKRAGFYYSENLTCRLMAAYDVARALKFLHDNSIVFRDLKPDNVAFDFHGRVKLFDFGLARELKARDLVRAPDSYCCTGRTGTLRWMPPEVMLARPYGLKADVYSFSLLFWYLMSMQMPYNQSMSTAQHVHAVAVLGKRPRIPISWPRSVKCCIRIGWCADPAKRFSIQTMCKHLQKLTLRYQGNVKTESIIDRSEHLRRFSHRSVDGAIKPSSSTKSRLQEQ